MAMSSDSVFAAVAAEKCVIIWNLETKKIVQNFIKHEGKVIGVAFSKC